MLDRFAPDNSILASAHIGLDMNQRPVEGVSLFFVAR